MPTILRIALLAVYIITITGTAQELTPTVDLNLQPVTIEIPERFRAQLGDENLTLNLPPGFSAGCNCPSCVCRGALGRDVLRASVRDAPNGVKEPPELLKYHHSCSETRKVRGFF